MAASQYLATSLVAWIRGTSMPAAPSAIYIGLHAANGTELSGNGYSRIAINAWGSITNAGGYVSVSNSETETTGTASGTWTEATQYRLYDAATNGNALSSLTALTTPRTVGSGGTAEFAPGSFTFRMATTEASAYLATQVCEWISGVTFPTAPTSYVGFYTDGTTELSGNGYSRAQVPAWAAAVDTGSAVYTRSSGAAETTEATSTWTATPNFAIHDASSSGNALSTVQALTASITVSSGGYARIAGDGSQYVEFRVPYAA